MVVRTRIAIGVVLVAAAGVGAQAPNPDPHWGANAFPEARTALRFSLSANRFTEFDGERGEPGAGVAQPGRFPSDLGYTTGFQLGTFTWTDRVKGAPNLTYSLALGAGWSADEPTRTLQNDVLHWLKEIEPVPVGATRSGFEMVTGCSVTWWSDPVPRVPAEELGGAGRFGVFSGAGVSAGTLYQEAEVHGGLYAQTRRFDMLGLGISRGALRGGLLVRGSAHAPGDAFREVSDFGVLAQAEVTWVPDALQVQPWYLLGAPSLGVTLSWDSGLFEDFRDSDPIDVWFWSVRAEWPNGLRVETWNDMLNGTDFGPTFGVMVGVDVTAMLGGPPW